MDEKEKLEVSTTAILGFPLLSDAEKQTLLDHGRQAITPPPEVKRFADYQEWLSRGGAENNFWMKFNPQLLRGAYREPQWVQRFALLYPELDQQLIEAATQMRPDTRFDEETQRKFFEAYDKLADLVDRNDVGVNGDLPFGEIEPHILLL